MSSPRAEAGRKRETRTTTTKSHGLLFQLLLPLPGAKASAASAHGPRDTAVKRARCTPRAAIEPPSAVRLSNSHDTSASGASSPSRTARRPTTDQARRELTEKSWLRKDKTSATSCPEGCLKDVFTGDSDSSDGGDCRKKLYVMYGGSWELTSRRSVKSLC
jgi:hypothetical protein